MGLTRNTRYILSGDPLPVSVAPPKWLQEELGISKWYVAQPPDWLHDNALAHAERERVRLSADKDLEQYWRMAAPEYARRMYGARLERKQERVDELEAAETLSREEEIELESAKFELEHAVPAGNLTFAEAILREQSIISYFDYLLPRCVCDKDARPLFDVEDSEGRALWADIQRMPERMEALQRALSEATGLIPLAKNSEAGRSGEIE